MFIRKTTDNSMSKTDLILNNALTLLRDRHFFRFRVLSFSGIF